MNRYGKYFLQNILWLDDGFCQYYLQDSAWDRQEILDVESVVFNWPEEAEQWINQCADHDPFTTLRRLRSFLAEESLEHHIVHKMNNKQVVRAASRQLSLHTYQVVIEPRMGWAVQVDVETSEPVQPIGVEPAPDIEDMLDQLRIQLDGLVTEQKKNYDTWEVKLASMDESEKALLYSKQAGGGLYNATIGSVVGLVKSLPGLAKKAAKVWWKFKSYPLRLAKSTAQAIQDGSWGPLKREVEAVVDPVVRSAQKVKQVTSMVAVLLGEPVTRDLLLDFVDRYWDTTHPLEKTEMGAEAASEVVMTILLAIFTAGVGVAANIAIKSGRLAKVAKLLEKIASTLKRVSSLHRLPKKRGSGGFLSIFKKNKTKTKKGGVPEPDTPKKKPDIDNKDNKEYPDKDRSVGPKTTGVTEDGYQARTSPEITQSVLDKIDPTRFSPDTRFGKAFYVADKGDVAVAEVAYHGATPTHMIRYKLDLSKAKVLDLTDPAVVKKWGAPGGNNYAKTQAIAEKAQEAGFDAIRFPSQRADGNNIAIFDKFDEILSPQMVTPVK